MRARRILLIDDDEAFVESNRDLLEAYDYEVMSASNGVAGLEKAKKLKPDLMILDVMMEYPTEGFDVARQVRQTPGLQDTPILLVTGVMNAMGIRESLFSDKKWLPVDRILEKPIDPSVLIKEVERILGKKGEGEGK